MVQSKSRSIAVLCLFILMFYSFTVNAQTDVKSSGLPNLDIKLHSDKIVNLNELKGKVVLLDFWYRGCAPCLQAIPELIALQEEFKDDLVILGINNYDIQEDVVDYVEYKKMNYLSTYKTDKDIAESLNLKIEGYPTTALYDRQGNLIKKDAGYSKGKMKSLRNTIKRAIKS